MAHQDGFSGAVLRNAHFGQAHVRGTAFNNCEVIEASFHGAVLEGTRLFETESATEFATKSLPLWWASASLEYYTHYLDNVKKVTRADIQRYLDRWLKDKNYVLGVSTNPAALEKLALKPEEVLQ